MRCSNSLAPEKSPRRPERGRHRLLGLHGADVARQGLPLGRLHGPQATCSPRRQVSARAAGHLRPTHLAWHGSEPKQGGTKEWAIIPRDNRFGQPCEIGTPFELIPLALVQKQCIVSYAYARNMPKARAYGAGSGSGLHVLGRLRRQDGTW